MSGWGRRARRAHGDFSRVEQLRTTRNSCPVPECGTGRYNFDGNAPVAETAPDSLKAVR